jgi:hypothetical protein
MAELLEQSNDYITIMNFMDYALKTQFESSNAWGYLINLLLTNGVITSPQISAYKKEHHRSGLNQQQSSMLHEYNKELSVIYS